MAPAVLGKKVRNSPKLRVQVVGGALAIGILAPIIIVFPSLYIHIFSKPSLHNHRLPESVKNPAKHAFSHTLPEEAHVLSKHDTLREEDHDDTKPPVARNVQLPPDMFGEHDSWNDLAKPTSHVARVTDASIFTNSTGVLTQSRTYTPVSAGTVVHKQHDSVQKAPASAEMVSGSNSSVTNPPLGYPFFFRNIQPVSRPTMSTHDTGTSETFDVLDLPLYSLLSSKPPKRAVSHRAGGGSLGRPSGARNLVDEGSAAPGGVDGAFSSHRVEPEREKSPAPPSFSVSDGVRADRWSSRNRSSASRASHARVPSSAHFRFPHHKVHGQEQDRARNYHHHHHRPPPLARKVGRVDPPPPYPGHGRAPFMFGRAQADPHPSLASASEPSLGGTVANGPGADLARGLRGFIADEMEVDAGPCGRRGIATPEGGCLCTVLWTGPKCTEGEVFQFDDTIPALHKPQGFLRDITMSTAAFAVSDREIKIHLPGKIPPWRYIAKAKGDLLKMVPAKDPVTQDRYRNCAMVGNSAILLNAQQGNAINQHDMIFRFNGAPTKGFEKYVGSRTDFRLSNSKWIDFRETNSEHLLWNMRAAGSLETYKERMKANPNERMHIFTAEWVNYVGQTVAQLSRSFTGEDADGLLIALNVCHKVTLYGMQVSEAQGFPYHYHNQCPQPYGVRDKAEWLLVQRIVELGLANFNEPCIAECQGAGTDCTACRAEHPEMYADEITAEGKRVWSRNPMPEYCAFRAELMRREKVHTDQGGTPWNKEERDKNMVEIVREANTKNVKNSGSTAARKQVQGVRAHR